MANTTSRVVLGLTFGPKGTDSMPASIGGDPEEPTSTFERRGDEVQS